MKNQTEKVIELATRMLVGRTIVGAEYMTEEEADGAFWEESPLVLTLDDGTRVYPSRDDEGNGPGALFTANPETGDYDFPSL